MALLALYMVQVFSEHTPCLNKASDNFADVFRTAFILGFAVLVGDFINSAVLTIYFRFQTQKEIRNFGKASPWT